MQDKIIHVNEHVVMNKICPPLPEELSSVSSSYFNSYLTLQVSTLQPDVASAGIHQSSKPKYLWLIFLKVSNLKHSLELAVLVCTPNSFMLTLSYLPSSGSP